ncbi:hypothetical protein T439DRAFT_327721 [Meredithblackwellia eburnea MCA 4105]
MSYPIPSTSTSSSPAPTSASTIAAASSGKRKQIKPPATNSDDDGAGPDGTDGKRKRARLALSCKECKRRKIKCDRQMPLCTPCSKRGTQTCTFDILTTPLLPPTIARSSDLDSLGRRLAHVERYLEKLGGSSPSPFGGGLSRRFLRYIDTGEGLDELGEGGEGGGGGEDDDVDGRSGEMGDEEEEMGEVEEMVISRVENGVFGTGGGVSGVGTGGSGRSKLPTREERQFPPSQPRQLRNVNSNNNPPPTSFFAPQPQHTRRLPFPQHPQQQHHQNLTKSLTSIIDPVPMSSLISTTSLFPHPGMIPFTSSLTPDELVGVRRKAIGRVLEVIPEKEVVRALVGRFFTHARWLFPSLLSSVLQDELAFFWELTTDEREERVDVGWLGVVCMVLAISLDSLSSSRSASFPSPSQPQDLDLKGLKTTPSQFAAAAQSALYLSQWEVIPRVRSVQTIILLTQFLQLSSPSRGQPLEMNVWLAGGVRVAQGLGLHLLGMGSGGGEIMPPDDPAWPPGKNSLKREMGKRLCT